MKHYCHISRPDNAMPVHERATPEQGEAIALMFEEHGAATLQRLKKQLAELAEEARE